ncbi:hypothetical protein HYH03_008332 [Edaphochlamys debaryana]|uniref:Peptidase A2 domain-containing protein n=1 Tax=Edaphochlamys debaryana TaxID=47281 RepID=A0A835Y082_9CHLO|nr:hypothetical protein HYH03_008332 [Edaphochlamys debaryana]|eukprot:KAG2493518.1 hypothetical protein HYH03_008332 [Edaphochlamys debaryana]
MECDDHEAAMLTTYLRTGCWLRPGLRDRLDIQLLPTPALSGRSSSPSDSAPPAGGAAPGGPAGPRSGDDGPTRAHEQAGREAEEGGQHSSQDTGSSARGSEETSGGTAAGPGPGRKITSGPGRPRGGGSKAAVEAAPAVVAIGIRQKGRKLRVRALVRTSDWRLLGFDHRLCADTEAWELGEWKDWAPGVRYPSSALHRAANGGQHAYLTKEGSLELPAGASSPPAVDLPASSTAPASASGAPGPVPAAPLPSRFTLPLLPPIPADTSFAPAAPGEPPGAPRRVPLWRAASGHFLVRPCVNGREGGGYWVLDTGASGFVLTPQAAARLGGQSFGEAHAAGIGGKVAARFVRLQRWELGGLELSQPVLMVMELAGLVRGAPGEVVGIVGYDLLRRATLAMPRMDAAALRASSQAYLGSGSSSESDTEEEPATAPVAAAAAAAGSARAPPGPPPPPPRSTPAFGPSDAGASPSTSAGGGGGQQPGSRRWGRSRSARAMQRAAQTVPYTLHEMGLHNPLEFAGDAEWAWQPLVMISNLPHIEVTLAAPPGCAAADQPRRTLLMLDSGACGADVVLHERAQRELGLGPAPGHKRRSGSAGGQEGDGDGAAAGSAGHYLRGVGSGGAKEVVQLQVLELPWLDLGGVRFDQVRCMVAHGGAMGLDLSLYSGGILCGDLLARVEWALDYTHKRVGFRRRVAS